MKNIKKLIENLKLELTEEILIRKHSGILIPSSKLHSLVSEEVEYEPELDAFIFELVEWEGSDMILNLLDTGLNFDDAPGIEFKVNLYDCGIDLLIQILSLSEEI